MLNSNQLKYMKKYKKAEWKNIFFILPSLIGVCAFNLVPFMDVVRRSFASATSGKWVGVRNYKAVINNAAFQLAVKNTFRFIAVCIPILLILSLGIAVLIKGNKKIDLIIKSGFLIPMGIPVASVVLFWRVMFDKNGLLNGMLEIIGIKGSNWMNTDSSFWILILSFIWKNLGYSIILWLAGLSTIPHEIYEAARVDGAGGWQCFLKITLPNLLPSIYINSVLSLLNSFKVFREVYLVAGSYPHQSIYLLQHLFNNWFRNLSIDMMSAGAVLNSIMLIFLIFLFQKSWIKKE